MLASLFPSTPLLSFLCVLIELRVSNELRSLFLTFLRIKTFLSLFFREIFILLWCQKRRFLFKCYFYWV